MTEERCEINYACGTVVCSNASVCCAQIAPSFQSTDRPPKEHNRLSLLWLEGLIKTRVNGVAPCLLENHLKLELFP